MGGELYQDDIDRFNVLQCSGHVNQTLTAGILPATAPQYSNFQDHHLYNGVCFGRFRCWEYSIGWPPMCPNIYAVGCEYKGDMYQYPPLLLHQRFVEYRHRLDHICDPSSNFMEASITYDSKNRALWCTWSWRIVSHNSRYCFGRLTIDRAVIASIVRISTLHDLFGSPDITCQHISCSFA